ncbi:MAG: NAD(P)-dependent oxidoreductase [Clostridiales bacterium]|nr:NAD(P)-dependent oxidoreductase [Clostridiales bacterium]
MKILVTGGSGSIGKAFVKKYKKTFDIVAPTHEQMDLTDARSVAKVFQENKFDAVLHLACLPDRGANATLEADNLIMFKNVQYMAIAYGVKKLITVGEGVEFDSSTPIVDFTEEMLGKHIPHDAYGLGRYLITMLAGKDKITTVLRLFTVYGADGGKGIIDKIVQAGARGKKQIVIQRDRVVSTIAIDDALRVFAEFLQKDLPRGDYNLVSNEKTSYLEIAKQVKRLVRKDDGDIEIVVKNDEPLAEYSGSNQKLLSVLPNLKLTPVQNGVKSLYFASRKW